MGINKNVAKTTFETGPSSKLAPQDLNGNPATSPTNTMQSISTKHDAKIKDGFKSLSKSVGKLSDNLRKFRDKTRSVADTVSRFKNVLDNPKELRRTIGKEVFGRVLDNVGYKGDIDEIVNLIGSKPSTNDILRVLGQTSDEARVIVDGIELIREAKDIKTFFGVSELLNELTGDRELMQVIDVGSQIATTQTVIDIALEYDIPGVIDVVVADRHSEIEARQIRVASTLNAAVHSNVNYIKSTIEKDDIGVGPVMAMHPDMIPTILENFRFKDRSSAKIIEESTKLIELLFNLNPEWYLFNRMGEKIPNTSICKRVSRDAIEALMRDERTVMFATVASLYPEINSISDTFSRRSYPPVKQAA